MSSSVPDFTPQIYSRKDKSLGVLSSNFLKLYNREDAGTIGLDDAASRLGVQRRRMYDVVNILESVGIVARKGKNLYLWKGFREIPRALNELKASKNKETDGFETKTDPLTTSLPKTDSCRRDKSMALLTENFIKLFLCSDVEIILLEDAAKIMLGDAQKSTALRTKVRRLYDIANVLSSINLIEKTNHPEHRKTAYRWLGGKDSRESEGILDQSTSRKRIFGVEITNYNLKRKKTDSSMDSQSHEKILPVYGKQDALENEYRCKTLQHPPKCSSKAIDFGPFAPVKFRREDQENRHMRQVHDMETMSSRYCPEYYDQGTQL